MRPYSEQSRFQLHPLIMRREGDFWIVGNEDTGIYVRISQKGYELLRLFEKGHSVSEIRRISEEHLGKINLDAFIRNLLKHGFVKAIDGNPVNDKIERRIRPMLTCIKARHVRWLFSDEAYIVYAAIIALALGILAANPKYLPRTYDYFFTGSLTVVVVSSFVVGWILVFLHELAHMLACISYNLKASFGITNRLYYLVAITDVTNVYSLKREKRYRVFLAGIVMDLLITALSVILLHLSSVGTLPAQIQGFLKFLILIELFGISWQFYFFMKTDIYYAFENLTGVNNLHKKTELLLRQVLKSIVNAGAHHHFRQHYESRKEQAVVIAYSVFYALGYILSILVFILYGIPIIVRTLSSSIGGIMRGAIHGNPSIFYDSIVFLSFWLVNQALLIYALIKRYKLYERPVLYWVFIAMLITTNYLIVIVLTALILNRVWSEFVILVLMAALGFAFARTLLWLAEKLNSLANEVIIPLMVPVLSLIVAFIVYGFSSALVKSASLPFRKELLILMPIIYVMGSAVCYLTEFRKA